MVPGLLQCPLWGVTAPFGYWLLGNGLGARANGLYMTPHCQQDLECFKRRLRLSEWPMEVMTGWRRIIILRLAMWFGGGYPSQMVPHVARSGCDQLARCSRYGWDDICRTLTEDEGGQCLAFLVAPSLSFLKHVEVHILHAVSGGSNPQATSTNPRALQGPIPLRRSKVCIPMHSLQALWTPKGTEF